MGPGTAAIDGRPAGVSTMDEKRRLDVVGCPECGQPAEIVDRFALASTGGPVEHVTVWCVDRHWFRLPIDRCPGWDAGPVQRPEIARDGMP